MRPDPNKGVARAVQVALLGLLASFGPLALLAPPGRAAPPAAPLLPLTPTLTLAATPTRIIINEVAWAGTAASSADEWLELHNPTTQTVSLTGWTITGTTGLTIALSGLITPGGYFLLERSGDDTVSTIPADQLYSGSLNNSGDRLVLSFGGLPVDRVDAAGGWPAGNAAPDYASMERIDPRLPGTAGNWAANNRLHRNGLDAGGGPINGTPRRANSTTYPPPPVVPLLISELLYDGLTPSTEGDEFAELCNPTTQTATLTGYKIGDEETPGAGEGMYRFPDGLTLAPAACLLVAKNAAQFKARFGLWPDFETVAAGANYTDTPTITNLSRYSAWGGGSWALTNHADELLLLGPDDRLVDAAAYRDGDYAAVNLLPAAAAPEPFSLHRIWPADSNWMAADFFRDAPTPGSASPLPAPPPPAPAPTLPDGMRVYIGGLNAASTFSDGSAPPLYLFAQARAAGLNFFAVTDPGETLTPAAWDAARTWAVSATVSGQFVALPGVRWQQPNVGSISIFGLNAPISPADPQTATLPDLYAYLTAQTGAVAQFNAPAAGDFNAFAPDPAAVPVIALQEVSDNAPALSQLRLSRAQGWRTAPTANPTLQPPAWGADSPLCTGVLAPALSEADLLAALRARRVFATTDRNFTLALRANNAWMGSELPEPGPATVELFVRDPDASGPVTLTLFDRDAPLASAAVWPPFTWLVAVTTQQGHYYWAQGVQADGGAAYTAPIWIAGKPRPDAVLLNELLPAPADTDWNGDGAADSGDEWVELANPGPAPVNLEGWWLDDAGGKRYTLPPGALIQPERFWVVQRVNSNIALNNSGDTLALHRPDGSLADSIRYDDDPGDEITVCRHPVTGEWHTRCLPTLNAPNAVLPPLAPLELNIYDVKHVTEGAWVTVRGYVTVPPGLFGDNTMYIQDDTHGIRVKLPSGHGLWFDLGWRVEVTGYLDLYYNEWEIDVRDKSDLRRLEGFRLIPPLPIGSGLLREGYEGLLVQLDATPVAFKKGSRHFWVDDGSGLAYIYIYHGTHISRRDLPPDAPLTIVGIAGQRTRSRPPFDGYRLYPRYPFDLTPHPLPPPPDAPPAGWPTTLPETGFAPLGGGAR